MPGVSPFLVLSTNLLYHLFKMASYDVLGRFYDEIMGDQKESSRIIRRLIRQHHPKAVSLLEIACGTGSYLFNLKNHYNVAGLDHSSVMLSITRDKLPDVPLFQTDMLSFRLNQKFDAVICMNDSINHLLKIRDWEKLLSKVSDHLSDKGVFIFDINTVYKLEKLSKSPTLVHEFNNNFLITNVYRNRSSIYEWDLRIFEDRGNDKYQLHQEVLSEKSFSVIQIKRILLKKFKKVLVLDFEKDRVTSRSERLHFIAIKE